jgi:hypothetical protein
VSIALAGALLTGAAACSGDSNGEAGADDDTTTTILVTPNTDPIDIPEECPFLTPAAVEEFMGGKPTQGTINDNTDGKGDGSGTLSCRITRETPDTVESLVVTTAPGTALFEEALRIVPNAAPLSGLGDQALLAKNAISGATVVQFTKGDTTYSITHNIGGFGGTVANPAQKHDQLMAMIQEAAAALP